MRNSEGRNNVPVQIYQLEGSVPIPAEDIQAESLNGASQQLPPGVYTTFRTYFGNRALCLGVHWDRLEHSARLLGSQNVLRRRQLQQAVAEIVARHGFPESRLRITWALPSGTLYGAVSPFTPLAPEVYRYGVQCITQTMQREQPKAKNTNFIAPSRQLKRTLSPDLFEVIMCTPEEEMLEGMTSNFFAIREGLLYTAGRGVLEGVTRRIVLSIARHVLPVQTTPLHRLDLNRVSEPFITSSSRELVPVVKIDDFEIGNGRPGPITKRILRRYRAFVRYAARPLRD